MFSHTLANLLVSMAPAPDGAPNQEGHVAIMLVFYVGIFFIFYFLLIRPQSKRNKEVKELQEGLGKGDRVLLQGGMFATVHKVDEEIVTLEISEGVRVKAKRDAIVERLSTGKANTGK